MKTIWKYKLPVSGTYSLNLSLGYQILSFGNQNDKPTIWVLHDTNNSTIEVEFRLITTGEEIYGELKELEYVGTATFIDGRYVAHLFKIID